MLAGNDCETQIMVAGLLHSTTVQYTSYWVFETSLQGILVNVSIILPHVRNTHTRGGNALTQSLIFSLAQMMVLRTWTTRGGRGGRLILLRVALSLKWQLDEIDKR